MSKTFTDYTIKTCGKIFNSSGKFQSVIGMFVLLNEQLSFGFQFYSFNSLESTIELYSPVSSGAVKEYNIELKMLYYDDNIYVLFNKP